MKLFFAWYLMIITQVIYAETTQFIVIDKSHNQIAKQEGGVPEFYQIESADSLSIDASKYTFPKYEGMGSSEPNSMKLIIDKDHQYTVDWETGRAKYKLSKENLIPRFKQFDGLKSGQQFILTIGYLGESSEKKARAFRVQWVGIGKVHP